MSSKRSATVASLRRGLTLVEVLIALAVIGAAFSVLALTQVSTLQVNTASRNASDATEFANRRLEAAVEGTLQDFAGRQTACPAGNSCTDTFSTGRFVGAVITEAAGAGYLEEGLIRLSVRMTEPAAVEFSRLVSCLDVTPPPSIALPSPCPEAVTP